MGIDAETIEAVYYARYRGFRDALTTVTGNQDSARDSVQEAFAIALAKRAGFRGGSVEAWIWRIALNCALQGRRAAARLEPYGDVPLADPQLPNSERDPELAGIIKTLSPRRRLIVFLRYYADLDYAQIAEACGVSGGAVGATLAQAHSLIAEALEGEQIDKSRVRR